MQALDIRLDQLDHRRRTLPEHAAIAELDARLSALRDAGVAARTEQSDVEREVRKAEADVEQVRTRAARDQQRLDAGHVSSPRELEQLQHEIATLHRRQSDLEDVELEAMERLETVTARREELEAAEARSRSEHESLMAARDTALADIGGQEEALRDERGRLASALPGELLALYEKIRGQQDGVGAAALRQRRCQGCRLELNTTDLNRFKAADPDELLRCEECRRILVRTEDSGL